MILDIHNIQSFIKLWTNKFALFSEDVWNCLTFSVCAYNPRGRIDLSDVALMRWALPQKLSYVLLLASMWCVYMFIAFSYTV